MSDRLLTAALRAYQEAYNPTETNKIYGTTTTLLSNLNNPLNISLLTSHLLTARSIWELPDGMRTCFRIISIFNTGARRVVENAQDNARLTWGQQPSGSELQPEEWARAVAKGADERSSRWKHLLVLTGILVGMENEETRTLSSGLRSTLEQAVVTAANLALQDPLQTQEYGANAVIMALTYAFPILSPWNQRSLNCDLLLPAAIRALTGPEGLQDGDFLRTMSGGNVAGHEAFHRVSPDSFSSIQQLASRPLVQNMGPLSRVLAFAVENATTPGVVLQAQDGVLAFSYALLDKWKQCPYSTIDSAAEAAVFPQEVLAGPWNMLWQLLKRIMYTIVGTLQPIVGRCLLDPHMRSDANSPMVASKTLHALRNLYFISSRQGSDAFQVYTFTYLTSIDILARYSEACVAFLQETQPTLHQPNAPPTTALDQALLLFYLNLAEHLPLSLPTAAADDLILKPATSQLSLSTAPEVSSITQSSLTRPLFEASHSAILSVMSCPQHAELTVNLIPFYIDTLLSSFPAQISPRQFRLAFKTVMQIVSPPFPISSTHPYLSETLLEMLHFRSRTAGTISLPPEPAQQQTPEKQQQQQPVSEQTTLILALIDALPFLPLPIVEDWLTRTAEAMNGIADAGMREVARRRFWDVLVSGEMDVERAARGIAWWGTRGGREMVLLNAPGNQGLKEDEGFLMSGALGSRDGARL